MTIDVASPHTAPLYARGMRWVMLDGVALALVACSSNRDREYPLALLAKSCAHGELSCPTPIFDVRDLRASQSMTFTANVDRLHAEFVRRNVIIWRPPTNMPWGVREMHVSDPDGNVIRIGSGIEHDD